MAADGGRMLDGPPPSSIPRLSPLAHPAGGVGRSPARAWTTAAPPYSAAPARQHTRQLARAHALAAQGTAAERAPLLPTAGDAAAVARTVAAASAVAAAGAAAQRLGPQQPRPMQPRRRRQCRGSGGRARGGRRRRMLAAMGAARVWRSPGPSAAALRLQRVWRRVCLSRLGQRPRHGRRRLCRRRCAPARGQRRSRWHRRHAVGSAGAASIPQVSRASRTPSARPPSRPAAQHHRPPARHPRWYLEGALSGLP